MKHLLTLEEEPHNCDGESFLFPFLKAIFQHKHVPE